jgi:4-hydroxybenzoyl-CoA thioesterase
MLSNIRDVEIRWGDCDPAGIVFYPRYFEIFDWCTALLFQAGTKLDKSRLLETHGAIGFPMVDTGARFLAPNRFGQVIRIESTFIRIGTSSFDVSHRVSQIDGTLSIEAYEKRVWTGRDPVTGEIRSAPLPAPLIAVMRGD